MSQELITGICMFGVGALFGLLVAEIIMNGSKK